MRAIFLCVAVAAALVACTLGGLDNLTNGSADAGPPPTESPDSAVGDAGASNAQTPAPDSGADADAGRVNSCGAPLFGTEIPLQNPGFELGCTSSWSTNAATSTNETTLVSEGHIACLVCGNLDGPDSFHVNQDVPMPTTAGQVYEVVGCVRSAPNTTVATHVAAEVTTNNGTTGKRGDELGLGATYQPIRATYTMTDAFTDVNADVNAAEAANTCLLLDDVRLFRVQ